MCLCVSVCVGGCEGVRWRIAGEVESRYCRSKPKREWDDNEAQNE